MRIYPAWIKGFGSCRSKNHVKILLKKAPNTLLKWDGVLTNSHSRLLAEPDDWAGAINWIPTNLQSVCVNERHRSLGSRVVTVIIFYIQLSAKLQCHCGIETQHMSGIHKSGILIPLCSHIARSLLAEMVVLLFINVGGDCHNLFFKKLRNALVWSLWGVFAGLLKNWRITAESCLCKFFIVP